MFVRHHDAEACPAVYVSWLTAKACAPWLQVLFYCHFPDLLLVQRRSFLRSIYRWPLNAAEELTTGQADRLLVNSQFTQGRLLQHCCSCILALSSGLGFQSRWVRPPRHDPCMFVLCTLALHLHTPDPQ